MKGLTARRSRKGSFWRSPGRVQWWHGGGKSRPWPCSATTGRTSFKKHVSDGGAHDSIASDGKNPAGQDSIAGDGGGLGGDLARHNGEATESSLIGVGVKDGCRDKDQRGNVIAGGLVGVAVTNGEQEPASPVVASAMETHIDDSECGHQGCVQR